MLDPASLMEALRGIHDAMRNTVVSATEQRSAAQLAEISRDDEGDTIYAIDVVGEEKLMALFSDLARDQLLQKRGVIVTDVAGRPLDAPLNVEANVAWAGYANEEIRAGKLSRFSKLRCANGGGSDELIHFH